MYHLVKKILTRPNFSIASGWHLHGIALTEVKLVLIFMDKTGIDYFGHVSEIL